MKFRQTDTWPLEFVPPCVVLKKLPMFLLSGGIHGAAAAVRSGAVIQRPSDMREGVFNALTVVHEVDITPLHIEL